MFVMRTLFILEFYSIIYFKFSKCFVFLCFVFRMIRLALLICLAGFFLQCEAQNGLLTCLVHPTYRPAGQYILQMIFIIIR